jgi:hypothetical protein
MTDVRFSTSSCHTTPAINRRLKSARRLEDEAKLTPLDKESRPVILAEAIEQALTIRGPARCWHYARFFNYATQRMFNGSVGAIGFSTVSCAIICCGVAEAGKDRQEPSGLSRDLHRSRSTTVIFWPCWSREHSRRAAAAKGGRPRRCASSW